MTTTRKGLCLRRVGLQDLSQLVKAHLAAFPDGFFDWGAASCAVTTGPSLTDRSRSRSWPSAAGGSGGYLVGILDPPRHRRLLLMYHGVALRGEGLLGLALRPRLLARFVAARSRRYFLALRRSRRLRNAPTGEVSRVAVLSHVVVAPEHRRGGPGDRAR